MPSPPHLAWLVKGPRTSKTADGISIDLWDLKHRPDPHVLSSWAKHFRRHYCDDEEIDLLRTGTPYTRAEYLTNMKFPDRNSALGPGIRTGDFAEILIADYLEHVLNYWVPRVRYERKPVRDESTKGSDIVGFSFQKMEKASPADTLIIFESKAQLSGKKAKQILQRAIDHSAKDELRKAESLNAIKQRLIDRAALEDAEKVSRFQSPEDNPYRTLFGAAALFASELLTDEILNSADTTNHPHRDKLSLVVISGPKLMQLVDTLYTIAANEA